MRSIESDLVYIVRDFLIVHRMFRDVTARYWSGALRFEQVQALVGDSEESVLFRLKERCHALFRADSEGEVVRVGPEALFDLAVGSLFHEAMKFRESLYQRDVYGPKVRALSSASEPEVSLLFREFERIEEGVVVEPGRLHLLGMRIEYAMGFEPGGFAVAQELGLGEK